MQKFQDKIAVITGAASGIGLATAKALARKGMQIALLDKREEEVVAAGKQLEEEGARVLALAVDVSKQNAVTEAAERVMAEFGSVHLLMNNAAVFLRGPGITEVDDDVWDWLLRVNLYGTLHCIRSFLPHMQAHGDEGHIINTGSISGFTVRDRKNGIYATSKFALVGLTEALAHDLAESRIGVSVVLPGAVASDFYLTSAHHRGNLGGPNQFPTTPADTANGMTPAEVAARLIEGIRRGQLYIATHSATREMLEARHQQVMSAYDAAREFDLSLQD